MVGPWGRAFATDRDGGNVRTAETSSAATWMAGRREMAGNLVLRAYFQGSFALAENDVSAEFISAV